MTLRALCIGTVLGCCQIPAGPAIAQLPQTPAPLSSFDCAKAADRIGQIICSDAELARWDARMGQTYRQRFTALAANERGALLEDQRQWLASRGAQCNQAEIAAAKPCILQITKARLAALEQKARPRSGRPPAQAAPSGQAVARADRPTIDDILGPPPPGKAAREAIGRRDYATALSLLMPLATQGDATAQAMVGRMYYDGKGVPQDYKEAAKWYRLAAEQSLANAQLTLGLMYSSGQGVKQNYAQAAKWFRKAADHQGSTTTLDVGQGVPQDYAAAVNWYRKAADQRDADAQLTLGIMYADGRGVPQDYKEGAKWFRLAADQGDATAQYTLGRMYYGGRGVAQDHGAAAKWYRNAAEQGNASAQFYLGFMYAEGEGVPQDYVSAHMWLTVAAAGGIGTAQLYLDAIVTAKMTPAQLVEAKKRAAEWRQKTANAGAIKAAPTATEPFEDGVAAYERGDYATAMRIFRALADQGDAAAQYNLGFMYANGHGVPRDDAAAAKWYRKAGDQGNARAQYHLGAMYDNGQGVAVNSAEALRWYRLAANQGDAEAQFQLGLMNDVGGLYVPQNYAEAVKWYRLAADQGHADAQNILGVMYGKGLGVAVNYYEAVRWYRLAADQGHDTAQYNLGRMYFLGHGVPQDYALAARWYRLAADQGNPFAQTLLGMMYDEGQGVPQDYVRAHMWFNLAAAGRSGGDKDAIEYRDSIARRMTPAQLAEAQRRAAEWRPKVANAAPADARPAIPPSKKSNPERFFGTAFLVSKDGKALTNAHVVEQCSQVRVTAAGEESAARIVARDDKNDLALLATGIKPLQPASWRLSVRQGEDIVVYGFPLAGVLASGGNVAAGNVTALAGLGNDSRFLQISAPVQPGNSGGPLLDRNGNVVGVVVAKLNALNVASVTGDIPQNVNFAIKASVAAAFLDAQHVAHTEGNGAAALSTPDIAERATALTAQVICIQ